MYTITPQKDTVLTMDDSYEGITIEDMVRRLVDQKEPIENTSPLIYTERKEGVLPEYNIRSDKWDLAIDRMTAISISNTLKREESIKAKENAAIEGETPSNTSAN